ncbi:MAG TPA: GNVR domain-containing protein [Vicinamibacterales bacterium]|nr:GNVR domain-containing protein [Vicinamibacterales bacterium]
MLPGKKYTPEDLLAILWRYKWLVLVPLVVASLGTYGWSRRLPNRYRAETLILVVPQRVPEEYVKSTVTTKIEDRLQSISQQILSRTRLERIVQDFNLYPAERRTGIMEDIVDKMRADIEVNVVKGDAFKVAYTGGDPRTVMKVTERLASLFIDESLRDREVLAEGTNQFLEAQLEDARRQLVEHEKKLEAFRKQYDGQLPSQVDTNLQNIRTTEMQLQSLTESLNRDRDQLALVERQIADSSVGEADPQAPPRPLDPNAPNTGSPAQQLAEARATLAALETHFTPEHPDVVRMKRVVRDLEAKIGPGTPGVAAPPPVTAAERQRQSRLRDLEGQRGNLTSQIAAKQADEKRMRSAIGDIQTRVAAAPTRESDLIALTRDYDTLQKTYQTLLAKKQDSEISANLERRQIGEQFKILDPARLPEKPVSPNRAVINAGGAAAGLAIGIALIALLEYRDTTLKTDADVTLMLGLPVLGAIPEMITAADRVRKRRIRLYAGATGALVALIATAVLFVLKLRG